MRVVVIIILHLPYIKQEAQSKLQEIRFGHVSKNSQRSDIKKKLVVHSESVA